MTYSYQSDCGCVFGFHGPYLDRCAPVYCRAHQGAGQMEARQAITLEARRRRDEELKRLIEVYKPKRRSMDDGGTEGA